MTKRKFILVALLVLVVVKFSDEAAGIHIVKASGNGAVRIEGVKSPPDDDTYDWWANVMNDGGTYRMWWVRGLPQDQVCYADSRDGFHFGSFTSVLKPVENQWEKMHVAHPAVIKHPNGMLYMFYESPTGDEWTDGPDNNIFLATSQDGINWTKHPSSKDPEAVIKGFNRGQKHYGVGLPSVYYKDDRFVINYVDDSEGLGNRMRRAESFDGIHWGEQAGRTQDDVRKHPITLYGNVGDVKFSKSLNRCVMVFSVNGTLIGQAKNDYSDDIYIAVSLDADGRKWAETPPKIWNIATKAGNLSLAADPDPDLKLRFKPTLLADPLGQLDGNKYRVYYTKSRQAEAGREWKQHWKSWDLYSLTVELE